MLIHAHNFYPFVRNYFHDSHTLTGGPDYDSTTIEVTFQPGDVEMTVSVPITDDGEMEGTEVFTATLTTISNHVVLGDSLATITILDSKNWQYCSHVGSECLPHSLIPSFIN